MKVLSLVLVGVIAAASARGTVDRSLDAEWEEWKLQYEKSYQTEEEEHHRRTTWEFNLKQIARHNIRYNLGEETFTMGANKFTDMTRDEMAQSKKGLKRTEHVAENAHKKLGARGRKHQRSSCRPVMLADLEVPDSVDWRTEGYVTEVKDELNCISSQYFAVNGALEGQWFRKTGTLTSLSEQNLKDCCEKDATKCSTYVNGTCSLDATYQYIKTKGVESFADYPDVNHPEACMYNPSKRAATLSGYDYIDANEKQLRVAVASIGPIAAAVDSSQPSFMAYTTGVYNEPNCSSTNVDHAVLIVGYGTDPQAGDYWIVKNSFGPKWGMNGYILMSRNKNNQCGIASVTTYPYFSC